MVIFAVSIGVCGTPADTAQREKARKKKDKKYLTDYKKNIGSI